MGAAGRRLAQDGGVCQFLFDQFLFDQFLFDQFLFDQFLFDQFLFDQFLFDRFLLDQFLLDRLLPLRPFCPPARPLSAAWAWRPERTIFGGPKGRFLAARKDDFWRPERRRGEQLADAFARARFFLCGCLFDQFDQFDQFPRQADAMRSLGRNKAAWPQ